MEGKGFTCQREDTVLRHAKYALINEWLKPVFTVPPKGTRRCRKDIKYLTLCYLCLPVFLWAAVLLKRGNVQTVHYCKIILLYLSCLSIWTSVLIGCYIFMCDIKRWMPHIQTVQLPAVVHFYFIKEKKKKISIKVWIFVWPTHHWKNWFHKHAARVQVCLYYI